MVHLCQPKKIGATPEKIGSQTAVMDDFIIYMGVELFLCQVWGQGLSLTQHVINTLL